MQFNEEKVWPQVSYDPHISPALYIISLLAAIFSIDGYKGGLFVVRGKRNSLLKL